MDLQALRLLDEDPVEVPRTLAVPTLMQLCRHEVKRASHMRLSFTTSLLTALARMAATCDRDFDRDEITYDAEFRFEPSDEAVEVELKVHAL